jgi:UDPglucose--hexose-1-phosphate uridylyltransferase
MHRRTLRKPDGRALNLYARTPLPDDIEAPSPSNQRTEPNAHLRWHPFRAEWIAYATHRQHRTFLPPAEYNPLAPTTDAAHPTEVPAGPWEVAAFENLFPTLTLAAHDPPKLMVPTAPGLGVCEVVVFTPNPRGSLGALPLGHLELVIDVWADRYVDLGDRPEIHYVFPFENRGVEVGVTLHHPHGQIYAYPFVPPIPARELEQQRAHFEQHGTGLLETILTRELAEDIRLIYRGPHAVAFMPAWARYPYEVWIASSRGAPSLAALNRDERRDFARALKTTLLKLDGLWDRPFPYVLAFHQAPTDGLDHPEAHVHAEIYPAFRMPGRLKYLAGSELGAGVFTADTAPEEKVRELQAVAVDVEADA